MIKCSIDDTSLK
jgi:regulator of replication initiation timing